MGKDSSGTAGAICTKCGTNPRASGHDWCRECKAELQRRYAADRDFLLESRGYVKGAEAMRDALLTHVNAAHPNGVLKMLDVGKFIIETRAPAFLRPALNPVSDGQGGPAGDVGSRLG